MVLPAIRAAVQPVHTTLRRTAQHSTTLISTCQWIAVQVQELHHGMLQLFVGSTSRVASATVV